MTGSQRTWTTSRILAMSASETTPIYDDIRSRRPNPKIPPALKLTKRDKQRVRKYSQILTDRVWEEICKQWNASR